jgi:hypothetical protein
MLWGHRRACEGTGEPWQVLSKGGPGQMCAWEESSAGSGDGRWGGDWAGGSQSCGLERCGNKCLDERNCV